MAKKGKTTERQFKQIIQRVTQTLKELTIQQAINNLTDVEIKIAIYFGMCVLPLKPSNIAFINSTNLRVKKADAISLQEIVF